MDKKKQLLIIISCLLAVLITFMVKSYFDAVEEHSKALYIEFIEPEESYEVGSELEAIKFVKKTNATEIDYPEINTDQPGEKHLFYIAHDELGNEKEFVLQLNIVDPIFPVIELTEQEVHIEEGTEVDLKKYVKRAYDPVDGDLEYEIIKNDDIKGVGEHEILYSCKDQNGNQTQEALKLVIEAKKEESKEIPIPPSNNSQNAQNGANKQNQVDTQQNVQPAPTPATKPANRTYLFSQYGDMQATYQVCKADWEAFKAQNYSVECSPLNDARGIAIGMQLIFY